MAIFVLVLGLLLLYLAATNKLAAMVAIIFTDVTKGKK